MWQAKQSCDRQSGERPHGSVDSPPDRAGYYGGGQQVYGAFLWLQMIRRATIGAIPPTLLMGVLLASALMSKEKLLIDVTSLILFSIGMVLVGALQGLPSRNEAIAGGYILFVMTFSAFLPEASIGPAIGNALLWGSVIIGLARLAIWKFG